MKWLHIKEGQKEVKVRSDVMRPDQTGDQLMRRPPRVISVSFEDYIKEFLNNSLGKVMAVWRQKSREQKREGC